jgi:hypothetical protein
MTHGLPASASILASKAGAFWSGPRAARRPVSLPAPLTGKFVGVSANASVGVGANALLVGGNGNSIILQPLSVQAQTSLNVAAGVAGLRLTIVRHSLLKNSRACRIINIH